MTKLQLTASILALATATCAEAGPVRWSVGINVGPGYYYRPWGYPYYYYPYGYPSPPAVIYAVPPPPTVVIPATAAPTQVVPAPVVGSTTPAVIPQVSAPQPNVIQAGTDLAAPRLANADAWMQHLGNPDERIRQDAVMELGRMRAEKAVDSLTATLAGDRSPAVRDAAARALGLIGSPRSLTALTHAAQADPDRDVRRSAQFAVEIIQSNRR